MRTFTFKKPDGTFLEVPDERKFFTRTYTATPPASTEQMDTLADFIKVAQRRLSMAQTNLVRDTARASDSNGYMRDHIAGLNVAGKAIVGRKACGCRVLRVPASVNEYDIQYCDQHNGVFQRV